MRIYCFECGKAVTNETPENIIFRGIAQCPECIDKHSPKKPELLPYFGKLPTISRYNSLIYGWLVSFDNGNGERHSFDGETKCQVIERWNKFVSMILQD